MKKIISIILSLVLLLTLSVPTLATGAEDLSLNEAQKEALYAKYEEMIAAVNEEYGYDLNLLSFDEIETFYSEEEFAQILKDYCAFEATPWVRVEGEEVSTGALRASGVTTVPYTTTKSHGSITVTITIYGTFDVKLNIDGKYYIFSQSFSANATSSSSSLYYVAVGSPGITGYADGGRTMIVTQNYKVYIDNVFVSNTSVNAYFYFNSNTGTISAQ